MRNKKASSKLLLAQIIYIFVVVVFSVVMIGYVVRSGNLASTKEEIYAKQIALIIDKAKIGTQIEFDLSDLNKVAEDNKLTGQIINIDNDKNFVNVKLIPGPGFSYRFFNDNNVTWDIKSNDKGKQEKLIMYFK